MAVKKANEHKTIHQPNTSSWQRLLQNQEKLFLYQKICIFLLAFLFFANGIGNDFNIDDIYYTTEENALANKGLSAIGEIFTSHTLHDHNNNVFDYRPVTMLTFALQHQLLGSEPGIGHFINVVLYSFLCLLAFILLRKWFGKDNYWLIFLSMLLYTVHPLHTEVVDNIKCRDELLAALFGLLSIYFVHKWYITGKHKHIIWSVLLIVTGLLCKQTAIVYLAMTPVIFYFCTDMPGRKNALIFVGMALIAFAAIKLPGTFLTEKTRVFHSFENPLYVDKHIPFGVRTATASAILGWYGLLHIIPYPLSFYYGNNYVTLFNWGVFPALGLVAYLLLGYFILRNIRKKNIAVFGALIYLIGILPFSNLLGAAPGMMAERYTLASSLGYCIMLVSALCYIFKIEPSTIAGNKKNKLPLALFLLIFAGYTGATVVRNTQWKNSWTLYSHDIGHLQSSVKANLMYAQEVTARIDACTALYNSTFGDEQEMYRDSIQYYKNEYKNAYLRAVTYAPDIESAFNNLGIAYMNEDSFAQAHIYLLRARALSPDNADIRSNLAISMSRLVAQDKTMLDSAINEFEISLRLEPKNSSAAYGLSLMYMQRNDTTSAINMLLHTISKMPDDASLYIQLSTIYLYRGDTENAINCAEKGAATASPDPYLYQMLQKLYHDRHDTEKENYYQAKLKTAPRHN